MTGSRLGVAALALLAVCLVVVGAGVGDGVGDGVRDGGGVGGGVGRRPVAEPRVGSPSGSREGLQAGSRAGSPSVSTDLPAAAVLREWDRRRAEAYAAGSLGRLRALYVRGAGSSDVRVLEGYRLRGWRVVAMRMQVLAVAVASREPGRLRLRVTDRLAGAVAVRAGERVRLPRDRASTRMVTLVRGGDGVWRAAAVRTR